MKDLLGVLAAQKEKVKNTQTGRRVSDAKLLTKPSLEMMNVFF
jgi:hypothetical protein